MVNVTIYEPSNSLDINDYEQIKSIELSEIYGEQEVETTINFIVAKYKVICGQLIGIKISNKTNFYVINDFGYDKVIIIKHNDLDFKELAEEKRIENDIKISNDLHSLAKEDKLKSKEKIRISVIKKLIENKKIIKQRDASK